MKNSILMLLASLLAAPMVLAETPKKDLVCVLVNAEKTTALQRLTFGKDGQVLVQDVGTRGYALPYSAKTSPSAIGFAYDVRSNDFYAGFSTEGTSVYVNLKSNVIVPDAAGVLLPSRPKTALHALWQRGNNKLFGFCTF
ncbi:MAG: hypothetical protein KF865_05985 [Bdellovibrionaceae bacterium]|nr:hypothetical protein [Pseudobdellovibrionaceae bacterium]